MFSGYQHYQPKKHFTRDNLSLKNLRTFDLIKFRMEMGTKIRKQPKTTNWSPPQRQNPAFEGGVYLAPKQKNVPVRGKRTTNQTLIHYDRTESLKKNKANKGQRNLNWHRRKH